MLPEKMVPGLERYLKDFRSLYGLLKENYHFTPLRKRSVFSAIFPTIKDAAVLNMPEDVPILRIESVMHHPDGFPVEYGITRIRGDMNQCLVDFGEVVLSK
ncbi:UTRA domain-containing protein [Effusibacillus dendaii]|uniref:UTRA domain-containing protein n=1 Tax=Effusibacillus dendaii TaxID=2743772 RepID=UPI001CF78E1C